MPHQFFSFENADSPLTRTSYRVSSERPSISTHSWIPLFRNKKAFPIIYAEFDVKIIVCRNKNEALNGFHRENVGKMQM